MKGPLESADLSDAQRGYIKRTRSALTRKNSGENLLEVDEVVTDGKRGIVVYLDVLTVEIQDIRFNTSMLDVKAVRWHESGPTITTTHYGKTYIFHIGRREV